MKKIVIKGAKEHNLKNVSVEIPKDKFVVITGLSGSGKSSLAFDTIYAEGQRRYVESLSAYARQFLDKMKKPNVDLIEGLSPAIAIEQKVNNSNPRSTVGTSSEIYDYIKLLYARVGTTFSPISNEIVKKDSIETVIKLIKSLNKGDKFLILSKIFVILKIFPLRASIIARYPSKVTLKIRFSINVDLKFEFKFCFHKTTPVVSSKA